MRRRVSIFGATGSVGAATPSRCSPSSGGREAYDVVALTGAGNVALLAEQARRLGARAAVTADAGRLAELEAALAGSGIAAAAGPEALLAAAAEPVDWAMSAIVGAAGLAPGLRLARQGDGAGARQQGEPGLRRRPAPAHLRRARHPADPGRQRAQRHLPGAAGRAHRRGRAHHPDRLGRAVPRLDGRADGARRRRRRRGRTRTGTWASGSRSTAPPCSTRRWR